MRASDSYRPEAPLDPYATDGLLQRRLSEFNIADI
jgi:hypothetical protein